MHGGIKKPRPFTHSDQPVFFFCWNQTGWPGKHLRLLPRVRVRYVSPRPRGCQCEGLYSTATASASASGSALSAKLSAKKRQGLQFAIRVILYKVVFAREPEFPSIVLGARGM